MFVGSENSRLSDDLATGRSGRVITESDVRMTSPSTTVHAPTRSIPGELKVVQDATCTFCGCVCDDIDLTVKDDHIIEAKRACVLGKAWFLNHHIEDRPSCLIEGQPASLEEGYDRAAEILTTGKYPIVYGLSDSPCEA